MSELSKTENDKKYIERTLYEIEIALLTADKKQPRKLFDDDDLKELTASISTHGVLQPILFRQDEEGNLVIVSGERRYRASKLAGKDTIPAIYTEGNAAEIALVENMLRVDLTAIEEAEAIKRLQDEAGYTLAQLSAIIGKATSTISEILSINKLPKLIREKYRGNKFLSKRRLVDVVKGENEHEITKLFKKLLKNDFRTLDKKTKKSDPVIYVDCAKLSKSLCEKLKKLDMATVEEDKQEALKKSLETTMLSLAKILDYKVTKAKTSARRTSETEKE